MWTVSAPARRASGTRSDPAVVVAAEDLLALVGGQLDHVHDFCVRLGCTGAEAVEITETSADDLITLLAGGRRPEDLLGWLFGRARRLALQVLAAPAAGDTAPPVGPLAATQAERALTEALDGLDEPSASALLLRDSYSLSPRAVAVATTRSPEVSRATLSTARTALTRALTGTPTPAPDGHPVSPAALAALAEDDPTAPAAARRHVATCRACSTALGQQQRARGLLAGLAVHALDPADRAAVLAHLEGRAATLLPPRAEVADALARASDELDRPLVPWVGVALALLLAAVLGVATGAALGRPQATARPTGVPAGPATTTDPLARPGPSDPPGVATSASPTGSASPSPSPSPTPTTAPSPTPSRTPPAPAPPSPRPTPSPTPPAQQALTLTLSPTSGPNGTTVTVTGTGFAPGATVRLAYLDRLGQEVSTAAATADQRGRVRGTLRAFDPTAVPGQHTVRGSDGRSTASTVFTATV